MYQVSVGKVSQISQSVEAIDKRVREEIESSLVVEGVSLEVATTSTTTQSVATTTQETQI
jgi:hypothetical protein